MNENVHTKSITGDNVNLLASTMREKVTNRASRLSLIMSEAAEAEITACEKDYNRMPDFAVAYLAVFAEEVQRIVEECTAIEKLIKQLAS